MIRNFLIIILLFLPLPILAAEDSGIVTARYERAGAGVNLEFPLGHAVPAAIFLRGSYLWVVFSEHKEMKIPSFAPDEYFAGFEQVLSLDSTIIRLKFADASSEAGAKFSIGFADGVWHISADKSAAAASAKNPIQVKTDNGKIFIPVQKTGEPIKINDPEAGDAITIVPVTEPGYAMPQTRKFIDITLEETLQGVVMSNFSDSADTKVTSEGVEVTSSRGLQISMAKDDSATGEQSLLPFSYKLSGNLIADREALDTQITILPEKEKTAERFDLAKLYFSNGFYQDALGVLNLIKTYDPDFAATEKFKTIYGATNYLMRRYTEALKIFEKLEVESSASPHLAEIKLWRWAANLRLGDDTKSADWQQEISSDKDFVKLHEQFGKSTEDVFPGALKFVHQYPDNIKNDFYLMAAREKTAKGDYDTAADYLDVVAKSNPSMEAKDSGNFLRGAIAEKRDEFADAEALWRKLGENIDDRKNRVRATLYLINLEISQSKITKVDAVKKLEPLTVIWRGDQVELELLNYLGQLYYAEKQYLKAFEAWKTLVTNFPNTGEAVAVATKMQDDFISLFDGGEAYSMQPIDSLSLFFEFRELTPLGEKGDRIIRKLADHFIEADLLDSAATLLAHQIRYRASGDEKLDLVEKLVDVDISNKKPQDALDVLDATDKEKMTSERKEKRKYLRAEVLENMGKIDEALLLLKGDNSPKAQDIRGDIFWTNRDWGKLIDLLEPQFLLVIKQHPLSESDTMKAIRLAFAYAFSNESERLQQFAKDYSQLIANADDKKLFDYLSKEEDKLDRENVEETARLDDISSYLAEYNKRHAPVKPEPAAATPPTPAPSTQTGGSGGAEAAKNPPSAEKAGDKPTDKAAAKTPDKTPATNSGTGGSGGAAAGK